MYDTSSEWVSLTWRVRACPSHGDPFGRNSARARISEALCVCYGGVDSYDFHGLETIQCMVERRKGGETGVKWLQAYRGDKFWEPLPGKRLAAPLMEAALCRSHTLTPARAGFNDVFPTDEMRRLAKDPSPISMNIPRLHCTMIL